MARVYSDAGDIIVEGDGGRIVGSLARRPAVLLPEASWITLSGKQIAFPDFRKTQVYGYNIGHTSVPFDWRVDACVTGACMPWQEWGPNGVGAGTFTNNLAQEVMGTVPVGVNYLDIRVALTRTKNPSRYLGSAVDGAAGFDVPMLLSPNQVLAEGGSALVEAIGPFRRMFWIGLVGNNIVLRRYQSVCEPHPSTYPGSWTGTAHGVGWSHHGGAGSDKPNLVWEIARNQVSDSGVFSNTGQCRRGGPQACSLVDNSDFSSTYTGTITIRPGYIAP